MAIYKIEGNNKKLVKVDTTSLGEEDVWERELQRMLRDQPEVLEDGLLIISEEFRNWQDSNRRIDLLGLDAEGRLVVIELKRGYTGEHMDLQALRYSAMVANMTYEQAVDAYQDYLDKRANEEGDADEPDDAESRLRDHLSSNDQDDPVIHTGIPRIILASEDFGKELTTCVLWLNDSWLRDAGHEIKCVRLQPHLNGDEVLIETNVTIPLPEASEYQTRLGKREQEIGRAATGKSERVQGAAAFKASIKRAPERFRAGLERLYDAAVKMEQEKIADLTTRISGKDDHFRLELRVPGKELVLVSFNNNLRGGKERAGEINFRPTENDLAPVSLLRVDELIGPVTSQNGWRDRRLSKISESDLDTILTTVGDLYREASGHQIEPASSDG